MRGCVGRMIKGMNGNFLEQMFPSLSSAGYQVTSPATEDYNCIAWALNRIDTVFWPDTMDLFAWPDTLPREEDLNVVISFFQTHGYKICRNSGLEKGVQKIALYILADDKFTHVARQLNDGAWTSKIAEHEDIKHESLLALVGDRCGRVGCVMKIKIG